MIDKISFQIMLELCRNGRTSNSRIAQTLGISEQTVAKKINAMLADNVFVIKAIPNPVKMGYQASAFIGLKVDVKQIDDICAHLADNARINLVVTCFGRFDVLLLAYFRELKELKRFTKEELPKVKGITHVNTYLISEAKKRYREILSGELTDSAPAEIDEIDQLLIKELIRDGNPNLTDLGNKLSISVSTISRRITSLVNSEILEILAIPNPTKLGYYASAFVLLDVGAGKTDKICEELSSYSEVHTVMTLINDFDILFGVNTADLETLYGFLKNKIAGIDGVISMETFIRGCFLYFSGDAMFMPTWDIRSSHRIN